MRKHYLATCLLGALAVTACGGGDSGSEPTSGSGGGTATPTDPVLVDVSYDSLSVDERTSFVITATSSTAGASFDWTFDDADHLDVAVAGDEATVTVNELTEDAVFEVTVTASATGYEDTVETLSFTLNELDRAQLPPELSVYAASNSLEGVDTNDNSVRDDVEIAVYELYAGDLEKRTIGWSLARAMQEQILSVADGEQAMQAATETGLSASYCLTQLFDEETRRTLQTHVYNLMLDTDERTTTFTDYIDGRSQVVVNLSALDKEACLNTATNAE